MTVQEIVLKKLKLEEITPDVELAIEEIGQKIRNVCNIPISSPLPEDLNFTYANMVVELFNYENNVQAENKIKSVTMGKVSYDFQVASKHLDGVIKDYYSDLLRFRRLKKWKV